MAIYRAGTYTGNGVNDRAINTGNAPDFLLVKRSHTSGNSAVLKTSTMAGDTSFRLDGLEAFHTGSIKSITATGFTVGTNTEVNENGITYDWLAVEDDAAGDFEVGTFAGNGADNRNITLASIAGTPAWVGVKNPDGEYGRNRTNIHSGDLHNTYGSDGHGANGIQAFGAGTFQVGSHDSVNQNTKTMHYFAFTEVADKFQVVSWTGNSTDSQSVTGAGFTPTFSLQQRTTGTASMALRGPSHVGDSSTHVSAVENVVNVIQAFEADGHQVGTAASVNATGSTYAALFFNAPPPDAPPSGTAATELPSLTAGASGAQSHAGSAVVTLPNLTADADGNASTDSTGAAVAALPSLESAASGTVVQDATGTVVAELPALAGASSGTVAVGNITGTAAPALPSLAAASGGLIPVPPSPSAPSHGEEEIYNPLGVNVANALVFDQRCRITVGVDYKAWTGDRTVGLGELNKADVQWSPGAKPPGGVIESYGTPCFQWFRTRDDFFPEDPAVPFRARVRATFPQGDPVYTNGFVIGAIDGEFGAASDCRVLQVGAVDCEGFPGNEGKVLVMPPSQILTPAQSGYSGTVEVEVEWDPGNSPQYRLLVNGGEIFTSDDAPRPVFVGVGYPTFVEAIKPDPADPSKDTNPPEVYEAPGLADAPVNVIEVLEVTVEELGGGYESIAFPSWTTANAGGDLVTALEGERFTLEGRVCAKLFMSNVISARVTRSASSEFDTFNITLALPKASDPDTYVNLYAGTRWDCEPPVLIDTQVGDDAGNFTEWRRQIAGRIWKAHIEYGDNGFPHLQLSGPCIAMAQLYSEASMAFLKAEETLPGVFQNLTFTQVFQAMLEEARNLDGDQWEPTDHILAPDITPDAIGTGGQTLLSCVNDWWDRLGQKRYVRYAVDGDAQFGQVISHLQTIGTGTGAYGFRGLGGSASLYPVVGASRDDDRRAAPGSIQYHPNTSLFAWLEIATYGAAGALQYPAWPYPANAATWSDSLAYTNSGMGSLINGWPDKNAFNHFGGPAKHRLRNETVRAQTYSFEVVGQDYIEPDDEIELDDPLGTGYVGTIIVDRVEVEYAGLKLTSRVSGFATDPTAIMLRRK